MPAKAVVLAAGRGSRLCPLTPFIPKEMLPFDGLPAIHYVLAELVSAGVKDVMVVLSRGKEVIRDYLTCGIAPKGAKAAELSLERERLLSALKITFAWQEPLLGTAHAIGLAASFGKGSTLLVAYPDDMLYDHLGHATVFRPTRELLDVADNTGDSVLLAAEVEGREASNYGVLRMHAREGAFRVSEILEKPTDYKEARAYVLLGRMALSHRVMKSIPHHGFTDGEGIIPALREEATIGRLSACIYKGERYDLGSHGGYAALLRSTLK